MSNAHEYSVSELAFALKRTVEDTYGRVRVRGELGRVTIAKSGHCYLDIKDDKAVINSIMWKGVVSRLPMQPEEGMEVIAEGKMSTYPGRSNYQLIIERMEPAGVGALMALLEKRKKQFAAEGLFDESRKQDLPFLPKTIGVVTSPTGSVIRDILHRIEDRYPCRVLVWPALVQGDKAAEQIAAGINGFNAIGADSLLPKPDVLIVARGGGSMEDLWCFNEESVARAAANSSIPLISAVGHETDWTLIDYIADYRAPTPTGAAEVAVPVRSDLVVAVDDLGLRARRALTRTSEQKRLALSGARLPRLENVLSAPRQRLDLAAAGLPRADSLLTHLRQRLALAGSRLPNLASLTQGQSQRLEGLMARLTPALNAGQRRHVARLQAIRLSKVGIERSLTQGQHDITRLVEAQTTAMTRAIERKAARLSAASNLLGAYSYQGVLQRGYALVTDSKGQIVRDGADLAAGQDVSLTFKGDVTRKAVIEGESETPQSQSGSASQKGAKKTKSTKSKLRDQSQMGLF